MGYLHIDNLYKNQHILLFRECYAMEKVHGTSTSITWKDGKLVFYSGGINSEVVFRNLFDVAALEEAFKELGQDDVTIYGEGYGGSMQKMAHTYGNQLSFIAFDVKIGNNWFSVPQMSDIVTNRFKLEVVPWVQIPATIEALTAERDKPSEVAVRRGCGNDKTREGIVARPLIELTLNNGDRLICKHKAEKFEERNNPPKIVPGDKLQILAEANAIAEEWVTPMRLEHVLDKLPGVGIEGMSKVLETMVEDVFREANGEIIPSKEARSAITKKTATLFKAKLKESLNG